MRETSIKDTVKKKYAEAALNVLETGGSCCGTTKTDCDPITTDIYETDWIDGVPEEAFLASLGCGNPTAVASLEEGETVLDLGSGGGIDVFLSARRVGPAGFAYLPKGPLPGVGDGRLNQPRFSHIGGPWYTFTAHF